MDVATVLANVDGDAVGTAQFAQDSRMHRIGFVAAPGLTDGGNVVDVDPQSQGPWFKLSGQDLPLLTSS